MKTLRCACGAPAQVGPDAIDVVCWACTYRGAMKAPDTSRPCPDCGMKYFTSGPTCEKCARKANRAAARERQRARRARTGPQDSQEAPGSTISLQADSRPAGLFGA